MKPSLQYLADNFSPISIDDQKVLKGGTGVPLSNTDLQTLFYFNDPSIGGFTSVLGQSIAAEIRALATTDIGSEVLQELLKLVKTNPSAFQIDLTTGHPDPNHPLALALYNSSANRIDVTGINNLGLDILHNDVDAGSAFGVIAHELFHAYEDLFAMVNPNGINGEVNANLFASIAEAQYDALHPSTDGLYERIGITALGTSDSNDPSFKNAWKDIIDNKIFNLTDYNIIVTGFKNSIFNQNGSYNGENAGISSDISHLDIFNLFKLDYLKTSGQVDDGNNSSSSYSGQGQGQNEPAISLPTGLYFWDTTIDQWTPDTSSGSGYWYDRNTGLLTDPSNPNAEWRNYGGDQQPYNNGGPSYDPNDPGNDDNYDGGDNSYYYDYTDSSYSSYGSY